MGPKLFAIGAAAAVVATAVFQLWVTPSNPPGFHRDEASIALDAHLISTTGRDEDGGRMPLFFRSYGDYKSPLYPYLVAAVFRVTGPHREAARALSAVLGLAAVLLLGLLARRLTGDDVVALAVVVLAGFTPWLFELGRVALEVATQPLLVTLLLLILLRKRWTIGSGVLTGTALGLLLYSYTGNRLLAPLFAAALVVFAGGGRWRWLLTAWATFGAFLLLLLSYALRHPGALTSRYEATSIAQPGRSRPWVVGHAIANWFHDINPWHWATAGDPAPYVHNGGYGALYVAIVVLALVGLVMVIRTRRDDLWWRYVLAITVLAPIPAALTVDRHNAIRLAALPVLAIVLSIPALETLLASARRGWVARVAVAVIAVSVVVQFVHFVHIYRTRGPARLVLFDAGVPALLDQAFGTGKAIYIDYDDRGAQEQARWHAAEEGIPDERVQILPDGGIPPKGSTVFGLFQECDYVCNKYATWESYWLATAAGPRP
ncbi:MAG: glycosyltransferase family 39 protein [Gaiellaceae bacterium]